MTLVSSTPSCWGTYHLMYVPYIWNAQSRKFFLLAVHRRATYRWEGLVKAVDMSYHMGPHYGWFWCYWALKVGDISFGMLVFDRRALMK